MKEIENSDGQQNGAALDSVSEVIAKADAAFQAYIDAPKVPGEDQLAQAPMRRWCRSPQQLHLRSRFSI
jgi:methyl-accepting chemotaxis protein-3 (ribose and galactose sensor receptor)